MQYEILLIRENVLERTEIDSQICNIMILKIKYSVKCQPRKNKTADVKKNSNQLKAGEV